MSAKGPLTDLLRELGHPPGEDALRAVDELLREDPRAAASVIDRLLPHLARPRDAATTGQLAIAVGAAHLAAGDAKRARDVLAQGLTLLGSEAPAARARGALHLSTAELALGNSAAARSGLALSFSEVLALGDLPLLAELASALRGAGDTLAVQAVDWIRRERREGRPRAAGERLDVVARLTRALNSGAAGTAEPLYAIVRAIVAETGAERGFLMLYDEAVLRFELGLARCGSRLSSSEFAFSTTIVERALETASCVLVPDLAASLPFAQASSAREFGLRSALCAPLRVERRRPGSRATVALPSVRGIAGVLYVDATTPGSFGESDARFFEILADCAVLALRTTLTAKALEARPEPARAASSKRRASRPDGRAQEVPDPELAGRYAEFVTRDPGMLGLLRTMDRVAPTTASVLVRGESGTGKELVARALHRRGPRARGPFVAIDCGAVPDDLVQSELFGHEAGAFTGATTAQPGLLERADGGTLFLDEVAEMSPTMQASLLRALQEGEVRRIGGGRALAVDVRVVAATNRDLRALVERGDFRQDLLFRLAVVQLRIPPLREREGDLPLLVEHFFRKFEERRGARPVLEPAALERLEEHHWPGNVRELENVLNAASLLGGEVGGEAIALACVDEALETPAVGTRPSARSGLEELPVGGTLEETEKHLIEQRLASCGWNLAQAARSLGLDRGTLRRKVRRHGVVAP